MEKIRIELSWPPDGCHPNKNVRMHWANKAKARRWYRELCNADTMNQVPLTPMEGNIPVSIVFYPKRNGTDIDNMLAALKSGIDGMCSAIGIDDKQLRPMTLDVGEKFPNGKVVIELC